MALAADFPPRIRNFESVERFALCGGSLVDEWECGPYEGSRSECDSDSDEGPPS